LPEATTSLRGPVPAAADDLPTFGRFRATAKLGEGGMGAVYRARDEMLGRDVAIKVLTSAGELGIRERFVREARAIGAVVHPNILAVHDAGEHGGEPYLVMELAAHGTLRERVKAGPLPVETVREVGVQIARALAAAHAANIIHRDVKPANILCAQPGLWKLADFGIARTPDSTLTITGQFLGSPSYAAPESLRAGQFSAASDVYSLGATLYEALAGTPPHGDHDMQSVIRKLEQEAPPLATHRQVPGALGDAIMAAVSRDPAKRPTAAQLAERLAASDDAVPLVPITPAPATATTAAASRGGRIGYVLAGLAVVALVGVLIAKRGSSSGSARPAFVPSAASPTEATPTGATGEQGSLNPGSGWDDVTEPGEDGEEQMPTFVDQYGNPVDDETARQLLEQMQRDAASAVRGKGHGRGKWKKK
jgi:serine/threonine-protein kinase